MSRFVDLDYTRACVVGRTRQGKTYLVKHLLDRIPDWICLDVSDEYADVALQVFRDVPWDVALEELRRLDAEGDRIACAYIPDEEDDTILDKISAYCLETKNITLIVDEAHEYITAAAIPKKFKRLARRGAKLGCRVIALSQRHIDLNTNYVSQCDLIVSFQQLLKRDIDYLERYAQVDDLSGLRRLDVGEYYMIWKGLIV